MLKNIRQAIDGDSEELLEEIVPPFPIDLSKQFLDCFDKEFSYAVFEKSKYGGIDNILELIWVYARCRDELGNPLDDDYIKLIMNIKEKKY